MPSYDGTGPFGNGRPGKGLGPCGRFDRFYDYSRGREGYPYTRMRRRRSFLGWLRPLFIDESKYNYPEDRNDLRARKRELENELNRVNNQLKNSDEE